MISGSSGAFRGGVESAARGVASVSIGALVGGRYRLIRKASEGEMTEVWVAEDVVQKVEVAVKLLKREVLADAARTVERLEVFQFATQVAAKLAANTPHVVQVHDAGRGEHGPYLVMELVRGRTLNEALQRHGPIAPAAFAPLLEAVTEALSLAHAGGIVHRNLKPSNVLLAAGPGGLVVKVSDFGSTAGLAQEVSSDARTQKAAEVIRSPAYMSPEQIRDADTDARTDIWALGAVAYEALTGRTPFAAESTAALLAGILLKPLTPPSHVRKDLPQSFDAWFATALAKEPSSRFASVKELCDAYLGALGLAPSLTSAGPRGSLPSIPDPFSRPTFPGITVPALEASPAAPEPPARPAAPEPPACLVAPEPPARPAGRSIRRVAALGLLIAAAVAGLAAAIALVQR